LCSWTRFQWYRGRWLPFSCFARPDSFSVIPRALGLIFMSCAPRLIFDGTEGVRSRFHVYRSRTHFRRCRVCWVPFSYFARQDSFSAVPRASSLVFMFCAPELIFDGAEGVRSCFHVLCSRARFRRHRGRRLPFSCFARPDTISTVLRASGLIFMSFAPELIFDGTEAVRSRFHVYHSRIHFRRCRVCWVPFSCFVRPDSFSAVPRPSGPIFMVCAPGLIFGGVEGVRSLFHIFGGTVSVVSRFHVLRSLTHFRQYEGRRLPFSCFARMDWFSAEIRVWSVVFMFCALGVVSIGTEGVGSCFQVLRARTPFPR
jgi:hypothetical protein